ncbi:hypothetical protein BK022_16870 [Methylorubrum extorquens]|uniref:Uncharacterized protein n=1 Tax=Methylorubrum extorquens TaxID=408 RepID=A0A1S1P3H6_METEX|nr:hypothetical protein BK022_16870 [Methylorubrum extorquens]
MTRTGVQRAIASRVARIRMPRALVSPGVFANGVLAKVICGMPITEPSRRRERRAVISTRSNRLSPSGAFQQAASAG